MLIFGNFQATAFGSKELMKLRYNYVMHHNITNWLQCFVYFVTSLCYKALFLHPNLTLEVVAMFLPEMVELKH